MSGAPLFTLAADQETEQHGDNLGNRLDHLMDDRKRLRQDLATAKRAFEEQHRALLSEARTARLRTTRLASRRSLHIDKLKIKKDIVDRLTPLIQKGYVSPIQYEDAETELLQAKSDLELLSSQHEDAEQGEADLSSRIRRLSDDLAEKSSAIAGRMSTVEQEISQVDADRALLIKAPVSGEVTNILIAEGSGISQSEILATIIPEGDQLVAKLIVDSSIIGFVKVGTPVTLRYRSFPYEKFGTHRARVFRIPGSALAAPQGYGATDTSTSGLAYRIDVELPSQSINVYGRNAPLSAGMEVTADLMLDRRKLIEWMFEPLIGMRRRMGSQGPTR
jgi:membrane fusion protein